MADEEIPQSQVRKHYFLDQYVVIAPKRNTRPFTIDKLPNKDVSVKKGPLPIEDEPSLFEISEPDGSWKVKVVNNLYPALSTDNSKAYGKQEIVLETHESDKLFSELSVEQISNVLRAYQHRLSELRQDPKLRHISVFKNHGFAAGGSMAHTHSQIVAIDFIPPAVEAEANVFTSLKKQSGTSPMTTALEWEQKEALRVIDTQPEVCAIAPYASRFPYEVWLVPTRQVNSLCDLDNEELAAFARQLKNVAAALDSKDMSFNFYLQEPIEGQENHFVIKVTPRPNIWAGFEFSTNMSVVINPVAPEQAAKWYKDFINGYAG